MQNVDDRRESLQMRVFAQAATEYQCGDVA